MLEANCESRQLNYCPQISGQSAENPKFVHNLLEMTNASLMHFIVLWIYFILFCLYCYEDLRFFVKFYIYIYFFSIYSIN